MWSLTSAATHSSPTSQVGAAHGPAARTLPTEPTGMPRQQPADTELQPMEQGHDVDGGLDVLVSQWHNLYVEAVGDNRCM